MKTVNLLWVALVALGCSAEPMDPPPLSDPMPETGGSSAIAVEATGGGATLLATGGASQVVLATGRASVTSTGGAASTGGQTAAGGRLATGGTAAITGTGCVKITCRSQGPMLSGLTSKITSIVIGDGCDGEMTCHCQLIQADNGTYVGYCL